MLPDHCLAVTRMLIIRDPEPILATHSSKWTESTLSVIMSMHVSSSPWLELPWLFFPQGGTISHFLSSLLLWLCGTPVSNKPQ